MQERVAKRIQWHYPEGVKLLGEYWLSCNDPRVISIYEIDRVELIMALYAEWEDYFDIRVFPVVTGEQGMELAKQRMQAG